uniref:Immunoglobulin superfamily member 10-like n=1 Tax=Fundulus heteroclitus TaxID=8078 RepID=A0A3Q2QGD0_FUNHE
MHQTGSAPVALMALLVLTLEVSRGQSCPRSCNCYQANEVHCTFRSLLTIPPGLPAHTRRINLGFNSISRLHDKSLVGLKRVELLMLHSNDLQHLPGGVFKDMKSLQILKLSYNKLREISSSLTFSGLKSLLRLYLDHNLLQHIHPRALLQLPSLRLLRLQGNRLHQLHPHALCTLSILNTTIEPMSFTFRHLDLSNNSLTTLHKECVTTAPLLETLVLQANPWSCDCRMKWFLSWSLAHPGDWLLKCPGGPQCPVCTSPSFLQGQGLLEQTALPCTSPIINFPGKETQLESDTIEIQPSENFREPLGNVSLVLSDQQGYSVDLSCKITHSTDSPDIVPPPDLSWSSSSPLPLALSLSLDCPIVGQNYEKLWRILAYYSETAARLEREIMLSKAPALAYRYKQTPVTDGYYHTGVKASVKAKPEWLLQSAISIRLDRAQSNMHNVKLMYSTRVSAHPDRTFYPSLSSPASPPWVMILKNHTNSAVAAVAGKNIHLICDFLSSSNPSVLWILPDGSKLNTTSSSVDGRLQVTASGLLVQRAQLADSGLYYCVARAGRDFDVLPLRLVVKDSSVPYSSELSGPPNTGTIGDAVTLACKLSGSPEPLANWILPNGNVVWQGLAVSGGLKVHSNGSLSLLTTTQKDTGYYRCIAVNQYGSDTMSTQLLLKAHHISALETPFPRGPQSAAGRSTKIPAPSFWQINEGSGDEEDGEDQKTSTDKRRKPTSLQQFPNRKYLIKKPQRHGRIREGHARRFGELTEQKKHRFQNRHRLTTKKNRIDPQKWAELLAKIRQKTANSTNGQIIAGGNPTTEPIYEGKDKQMREKGKIDGTNRSDAQGKQKEPETEGSSVDDANVKEEQPQPIQPPYEATQTIKATQTIPETENVMEGPTDKHVDSEIYTKTQTEKESKHTVTPVNHVTEKEPITLNPLSGTNEIVIESSVLPEQGLKVSPVRTRLQNPQQGLFPNIIPNSRSRSPWITRRKIGQRRRINRPRIQPVPSLQPHSDPVNLMTQKMTFTPAAETIPMLLTMSAVPSTASMLLLRHYVRTAPNSVTLMPPSPTVSDTHIITISHFASPPLRPSPATPHTYIDAMIHSGKKQITEEPTFNSTPAPTHSTINISEAHVPETDIRAFKQAAQPHTATQTTLGKHAERSPSKHSKELETNVLGEPQFSITHSFTESSVLSASSTTTSVATITTTSSAAPKRASYFGSTKSTPASTTNEDTLPTTTPAAIISPTMSPSTPIIIPISSTPRQTSAFSTSTASPSTMPTSSSTTSPTLTSTTTFRPIITRISIALKPSTRQSSPPVSINAILKTFTPSFNTTSISTKPTVLTTTESAIATAPPTTIKESTVNMLLSTTTIMEVTSTKALPRDTEVTGQFGHPVNGQNKSQTPVDWKNHGANIIPDSHRSQFHLPSSVPIFLLSHSGTFSKFVSVLLTPVFSLLFSLSALLPHYFDFLPGAVMSIHSRAQRFGVLPNGTLVIQNVQVQDRGTYICSASSFLGSDRLITSLEVWTRPLHMQLMTYREVTVSQGGQVQLECQADGVPAPLLSWVLPNRSTFTSSSTFSNRIRVDKNGTLNILVALPTDRGLYRCVASNSAGAASASVRLYVSSLPLAIQQPREEHLVLAVGSPLYAHCSARGSPKLTLRWRIPDGTLVRPSQFLHGNLFVLPNGTLHIRIAPSVNNTRVTSSFPDGRKNTSVLHPQPVSPFTKARIVSTSPSTSTVNYGATLTLYCSVTGHPAPTIIWRTPTKKLVDMNYRYSRPVHPNGTLSVQAVTEKDSGDYLCIARNKVSDDYRILRVSVATQPPKIEPKQPVNHMVSFGKPLKVDCQASGLPHPAVRWTLPNGTTVNSVLFKEDRRGQRRQLTVFNNGTLLVPAVGVGEEGEYMCYADNLAGQDTMKVSNSAVRTTPPNFTDDRSHRYIRVRQGETATVPCRPTGDPAPTVTWFSPALLVIPQSLGSGLYSERVVVVSDGILEVRSAQRIDSGNYTCRASNTAGVRSMVVSLEVEISTVKGQTVILPCPYHGYPPLRLAWLLPGNGMLPAPYYGSRLTVHRNGSLELRDVRLSDAGTLMCLVKTERGDALMRVQLEVSEPWVDVTSQKGGEEENLSRTGGLNATQGLGMPDTPHSVNSPPSSGSVSKTTVNTRTTPPVSTINGETLRLHCPASQTRSTVSWTTPGGQMLSRGDRGDLGRYLVQEDGTLIIRQVSVFDRGSYTCRLYSPVSSTVSVITVPVIVIAYPPRITTGPSPLTYTTRGVAVELPCLTIGAPRATVTWETPDLTKLSVMGQPRIYGNLYLSPHGSLVIQNPTHRDTGFYRCIAKNVIGVDSKATYLHVM